MVILRCNLTVVVFRIKGVVWYFLVEVFNGGGTISIKVVILRCKMTAGVFHIKGVVWYFLFKVFIEVELFLLKWLILGVI